MMTKIISGPCVSCQKWGLLFAEAFICLECLEDLSEMVGITLDTYGSGSAARRCLLAELCGFAWSRDGISIQALRDAIHKAATSSADPQPQNKKRPTR